MLRKSSDKVLFGVCGGIAQELGIDPIFVRLACVIGLFVSFGTVGLVYLILAFLIPKA